MATKAIEQIELTNVKQFKHLVLKVNGLSFMLLGDNGTGKSTVLQSIEHMIIPDCSLPDDPITTGESEGEISLILTASGTNYKVIRKLTKKGLGRFYLYKDAGNGRWDSQIPAVERFRELFGNVLDLSPLIDMDGAEQLEQIQKIVGKDSGVEEHIKQVEANVKLLTEDRRLKGRDKKDLENKMNDSDFRKLVNYVGEKPADIEEIRSKKVDVTALNSEYTKSELINSTAEAHISTLKGIVVLDAEINTSIKSVISLFEAKKVDTTELKKKIDSADETNAKIEKELDEAKERNELIKKSAEYTQAKENIESYGKEYDNYTKRIKDEIASIGKAMAKLGLEEVYSGLSLKYELNEEGKIVKQGLFLRDLPFNRKQQSYGEMIKILVALSKAFNPDGFSFISIGYWNELGPANQEFVLELAAKHDITLGIEKVDSSKKLEIQLIER